MSDAPVQTQGGLESQPPLPVRRLHNFIYCPRCCLPEIVHAQTTSFDDALERPNGDEFVAVHGYDHLPAIGVSPFLVAAFLADHCKAVLAEDSDNFLAVADWEAFTHVSATSKTFAPAGTESGDGSNHNSNASFALRTASSSVSPAEAQPGSSGKKAAQRLVSGSCSTTSRSFMLETVTARQSNGKASSIQSNTTYEALLALGYFERRRPALIKPNSFPAATNKKDCS